MSGGRTFRAALDFVLPRKCPFCGVILTSHEEYLCRRCREELPFTTAGRKAGKGEFFTACVSPLYYRGSVRAAIRRFKFRNKRTYARCFAHLMAPRIKEELAGKYDVLTWTPVSFARKLARGYDQTYLLAKALSRELDMPVTQTLRRVRNSPPQTKAGTPEKRRANVSGVYRTVDPERFAGKKLLLIDDILTTGATLSEASRMLLMAGAASVSCATVARTKGKKTSATGPESQT